MYRYSHLLSLNERYHVSAITHSSYPLIQFIPINLRFITECLHMLHFIKWIKENFVSRCICKYVHYTCIFIHSFLNRKCITHVLPQDTNVQTQLLQNNCNIHLKQTTVHSQLFIVFKEFLIVSVLSISLIFLTVYLACSQTVFTMFWDVLFRVLLLAFFFYFLLASSIQCFRCEDFVRAVSLSAWPDLQYSI